MTDLKNMIAMFSNTDESFEKRKSGKDWVLLLKDRGIEFLFKKDGSFIFCSMTLDK